MNGKFEDLTLSQTMNAAQFGNSGAWNCCNSLQAYTPHLCRDTGLLSFFLLHVLRCLFFMNVFASSAKDIPGYSTCNEILAFFFSTSELQTQPAAQTDVISSAMVPFLQPHALNVWLSWATQA